MGGIESPRTVDTSDITPTQSNHSISPPKHHGTIFWCQSRATLKSTTPPKQTGGSLKKNACFYQQKMPKKWAAPEKRIPTDLPSASFSLLGFSPPKALLVRLIVMLIPGLAVLMLCWAGYRIYTTGSSSVFFECCKTVGCLCYSCFFKQSFKSCHTKILFCWIIFIIFCYLLFVDN